MPLLRPYEPRDLDQLYAICLRTGAAGDDTTELVGDPRLLGDVYAAPYAVLEPQHALVPDDGAGTAVAYVLRALDTRAFEERRDPPRLTSGELAPDSGAMAPKTRRQNEVGLSPCRGRASGR